MATAPQGSTPQVGPLDGVRVVELASVIMAPYATQLLGDLGADVIKVEPPTGDLTRHLPPTRSPGMGAAALNLNRNKRSVVIDLKAPGGRDALLALLATADVFVTNVRPQALDRLGLGYPQVAAGHPGLVYLNAQGYRSDSELGGRPAYDDIVQAASGLVWLNEQVSGVPYFVPTVLADKICGLVIVQSVLAALHHRDRTGQGQHVEVPMADTMLAFNLVEHLAAATLEPQGPFGYSRALSSQRRAARTADGWMCILPYSDRNWQDFFAHVGRPDLAADPRFASLAERARNADELYALMDGFAARHSNAEWQEYCDSVSIPAAPVLSLDQAASSDYAIEGGLVQAAEHPTEGAYQLIGQPVRFHATPAGLHRHCPRLGEHTDEVFAELGQRP
ncbi:CaiB/BaiF CoA transferase family protein [Kitasatospora viridis]|uniref:Crotonobetainyl-CoA:carnitine CoA-transferase CaiB-like acyl-CoA transferase n=1 Tax=Kitasatospora viridis TaxID=281105 RepID=A0A561TT53_9ACTN|nr:CoA transferase [Kitasatospora viridis]TWF90281.1 crotonobetainyl-CoA:carnitine CoA-transferase CaiB-like acyl-CoA transferase [Kitasatospora viridis]